MTKGVSIFANPETQVATTPTPPIVYIKQKSSTGVYILGGIALGGLAITLGYIYRDNLPEPLKTQFDNLGTWVKSFTFTNNNNNDNNNNNNPPPTISKFIYGYAFMPTGKPFPGVKVELLNENESVINTTVTDTNGKYSFKDLPAGGYYVRFSKNCYTTFTNDYLDLTGERQFVTADSRMVVEPLDLVGSNINSNEKRIIKFDCSPTTIDTVHITGQQHLWCFPGSRRIDVGLYTTSGQEVYLGYTQNNCAANPFDKDYKIAVLMDFKTDSNGKRLSDYGNVFKSIYLSVGPDEGFDNWNIQIR